MPINANHEFLSSEKKYLEADTLDDRIYFLEEMIRTAPKHKGSENLLMGLRTRLKKFLTQKEKSGKKSGGKKGIRKEGYQFVLLGHTNVGKSALLGKLTHASPKVASYEYTTREPEIGTFDYGGAKAQIIDSPSLGSEQYDSGLINSADCLIIVISDLKELPEIESHLKRARGEKIIVLNKIDLFDSEGYRKLEARVKSKRINAILVSANSGAGLEILNGVLFEKTGFVRVYMKEPGKKKAEKRPMVVKAGSDVRDVAEHIRKGYSKNVKEIKLTGPSSKFPNQRVGLTHKVKDGDIVEFIVR